MAYNPLEINSNLPFFPKQLCKVMFNFGKAMVVDDAHDIGYGRYSNRVVFYKGQRSAPNHQSRLHHYMPGLMFMMAAQIGGMMCNVGEFMYELGKESQNPEYQSQLEMDKYFEQPSPITLNDYKRELGGNNVCNPALPDRRHNINIPKPPVLL